MSDTIKCKKCRQILLDDTESHLLVNAHNLARSEIPLDEVCLTILDENLLFLNEDSLPEWIRDSIQKENWSRGKLKCKHCGARIGAFDFVSGIKCGCREFVLPAVHVIKSKVDFLTIKNKS